MNFDHVFKKTRGNGHLFHRKKEAPEVPEGLLCKCNKCKAPILVEEVKDNYYICPKCQAYFRVGAWERIRRLADEDSFEEWDKDLTPRNPLAFEGYEEKTAAATIKSRLKEAVVTGICKIGGVSCVLAVMDGNFMMGSLGQVTGEKITRAVEKATKLRLPLVIFTCSGGARMQEGIHSLMQMAKTSAAIKGHSDAGLLYISVLTDPTTGGVTASFAMEADIILAEPKALIAFAGPRVIQQTIGQKLPKGFQRSEFLLEGGFVDAIVERQDLRECLENLLRLHEMKKEALETLAFENKNFMVSSCRDLQEKRQKMMQKKSPWQRVQVARKKDRPTGKAYIEKLFTSFYELHGDRHLGDDSAIIGGVALFGNTPVTVIAQEKGVGTKGNLKHNFGMPSPEGYGKSLRLMKEAEKFHRPIICIVDTPGAYCGIGAEERGQGQAIARSIYEMSGLKVPILTLIIGEGGSGGALALAVANEVWMLENSIYSILSPEGFASILWKDSSKAKKGAEYMKLTAIELKKMGIVEKVFPEPEKYTIETMGDVVGEIQKELEKFLEKYRDFDGERVARHRYERFRGM